MVLLQFHEGTSDSDIGSEDICPRTTLTQDYRNLVDVLEVMNTC